MPELHISRRGNKGLTPISEKERRDILEEVAAVSRANAPFYRVILEIQGLMATPYFVAYRFTPTEEFIFENKHGEDVFASGRLESSEEAEDMARFLNHATTPKYRTRESVKKFKEIFRA